MARVKFGGIVSEISGSVGGSTFQKSLYGNTLRNKPIPIHKRTASQVNIRYFLQQLHAAWRTLDPDERTQWNRFINFSGQTIRRDSGVLMSGHDLFLKYNLAKLMIGDAILTIPTYTPMPEVPTHDGTIGRDVAAMGWALDDTYDDAALFFMLKLSSPRLASRSYSPQGLRWINCTLTGLAAIELYPVYPDVFGFIPPAGVYLHFSLQWFSRTAPVMNAAEVGTVLVESY
jgi:hypothetical protein